VEKSLKKQVKEILYARIVGLKQSEVKVGVDIIKNKRKIFNYSKILKIGDKTNNKCAKCGCKTNLHIHYIIPLSQGGTNKLSNLILLCSFCHKLVHQKSSVYYNEKKFYSKTFFEQEMIFDESFYTKQEFNWIMKLDSTDHFYFLCPKCKKPSIISRINVKKRIKLDNPPCFYFHLKCPYCKIFGQRKAYLNYGLKIHKEIKNKKNPDEN